MSKTTKPGALVACVLALAAAPLSAHADAAKDMQVAGRALTFLENAPTGKATLGVVFDPSKPASVAEKNAVMAAIGGGLSAGALTLTGKPVDAEAKPTLNPSYYVDYQDCAYVGAHRALCSGVSEYRPDPSRPKWALGGLDLVDLGSGRPVHQVPVLLWTDGGESMTRNPVLVETIPGGLRASFMPDDDRSTLYVYEAKVE